MYNKISMGYSRKNPNIGRKVGGGGGGEDIEFPRVLKKEHVEVLRVN